MSDIYEFPPPTMSSSSSLTNTCWALQQTPYNAQEKLLLIRIADGAAGPAIARFALTELAAFACCEQADVEHALEELECQSLIHVVETGPIVTIAMPWWRPGSAPSGVRSGGPVRKLQYKQTVRSTLMEMQCCGCWYCGESLFDEGRVPHVEHQIPLSRGGADAIENLVMACGQCNLEKGTRTVDEYRAYVIISRAYEADYRFSGEHR